MYEPGRDQRITGQDSKLEYETKGQLMAAFAKLLNSDKRTHAAINAEIQRLEQVLRDEKTRQLHEYERKHSEA